MSVAPGYVYELDLELNIGPWAAGPHPGLILGATSFVVTLVPMTSSPPRGDERQYYYPINDGGDVVSTPVWVCCHLLTTTAAEPLRKQRTRGPLPKGELGPIRDKVARYLRLAL